MRVHLGSDHAGLELKEHLTTWLREQGHEPVDHGPFVYDAQDDYPVFCLRAAEGTVADPGSLGVVIGGSGQRRADRGQQGQGGALRPRVERRDRDPGPPAQRRQRGLGRRPDAHGRGDDPVRRHLPVHRLHRRGAARAPHRDADATTRRPASCRRCRSPPSATAPMPEGHTLHRLATALRDAFAGEVVAVSSPQGGSRSRRRCSTAARCWAPSPPASTCSSSSSGPGSCTCTSGCYGKFALFPGPAPAPVGQVRLRLRGDIVVRRPAWRHRLRARRPPSSATRCWRASDPTRCDPGADPRRAWDRIRTQPRPDRRPADGPERCWPVSATSTAPRCSTGTGCTRCGPAAPCGSGQWRAMWADLVGLMADGVRTGRIETLRPEDRG